MDTFDRVEKTVRTIISVLSRTTAVICWANPFHFCLIGSPLYFTVRSMLYLLFTYICKNIGFARFKDFQEKFMPNTRKAIPIQGTI